MTNQFRISSEVHATPGDEDGSVLINLQSGKVFSLNSSGAKVWSMLEQGVDFETIVNSLAGDGGVSRDEICGDLEIFIRALECKGLVQSEKRSSS